HSGQGLCYRQESRQRLQENHAHPFRRLSSQMELPGCSLVNREVISPGVLSGLKAAPFRGSSAPIHYAMTPFPDDPKEAYRYMKKAVACRRVPASVSAAVSGVMACHGWLLGHYQWGPYLAGEANRSPPWQWPDVPKVPQARLH